MSRKDVMIVTGAGIWRDQNVGKWRSPSNGVSVARD